MLEDGFNEKDLIAYRYPDAEEFDNAGLQIVYLGRLRDWSLVNNASYSCANGLLFEMINRRTLVIFSV